MGGDCRLPSTVSTSFSSTTIGFALPDDPTRSAISSASSMSGGETTVTPVARNPRKSPMTRRSPHRRRRSARQEQDGARARALAIITRLHPPTVAILSPRFSQSDSSRSSRRMRDSARADDTTEVDCRPRFSNVSVASSCGCTRPISEQAARCISCARQRGLFRWSGVTIPQNVLVSVVLPAPFGPRAEYFALLDLRDRCSWAFLEPEA